MVDLAHVTPRLAAVTPMRIVRIAVSCDEFRKFCIRNRRTSDGKGRYGDVMGVLLIVE